MLKLHKIYNMLIKRLLCGFRTQSKALNLLKRGSKSFPYGLLKTVLKNAKTLQIIHLQGFLLVSKRHFMH